MFLKQDLIKMRECHIYKSNINYMYINSSITHYTIFILIVFVMAKRLENGKKKEAAQENGESEQAHRK